MSGTTEASPGAGEIAVLVEQAVRSAVADRLSAGQRIGIVRLLVAYLAPGTGGLTAEGSIVRHGRTLGMAEVWVRDGAATAACGVAGRCRPWS